MQQYKQSINYTPQFAELSFKDYEPTQYTFEFSDDMQLLQQSTINLSDMQIDSISEQVMGLLL